MTLIALYLSVPVEAWMAGLEGARAAGARLASWNR